MLNNESSVSARAVRELHRSMRLVEKAQPIEASREYARAERRAAELRVRCEVERQMHEFTNNAALLVYENKEEFARDVCHRFYALLAKFVYLYDIPRSGDLSLCGESCVRDFSFILLNAECSLYGCIAHGTVHECDHDSACPVSVTTKQAERVCVFSGRVTEKMLSQLGSNKDFSAASSVTRRRARFRYRRGMQTREDGMVENRHVPVARKKAVQSERVCTQPRFRPSNFRATRVAEEAREEHRAVMLSHVEGLLHRVLYDSTRREEINTRREEKVQERCENALRRYIMRTPYPSHVEELAVFLGPLSQFQLLPLVSLNHTERRRIAIRVLRLWELCNEAPVLHQPGARRLPCTLTQFTLAVLYAHIDGFRAGRSQFVPRVMHVGAALPPMTLLNEFSDGAELELAPGGKTPAQLQRELAQRQLAKRRSRTLGMREIEANKMVPVAHMLPSHWNLPALGDAKRFCERDLRVGRKFLRNTLVSYSEDFLAIAARNVANLLL